MGAITLSDGKEITVSVGSLTVREWREFVSPNGDPGRDDEIIGKCTGLTVDELLDLPHVDYRRIVHEIVKLARAPLADPN